METEIFYVLIAGLFRDMSPVLVKRGIAPASVSAATLYQQGTILFTLACSALPEGDIFAGKMTPIWSAPPIVSFLLAKATLEGKFEKVSFQGRRRGRAGRGLRFGATVG
jgi:hypothetical protein